MLRGISMEIDRIGLNVETVSQGGGRHLPIIEIGNEGGQHLHA